MSSDDSDMATHHPKKHRPRMDVWAIATHASTTAQAVTRPVVGENEPERTGEISIRFKIEVECLCEETVTVDSSQSSVKCAGCGRQWEVQR